MNGILLIDKPKGWTSFDVVAKVRSIVRQATGNKKPKVGHTGTLDPLATGLLVIVVGSYCKRAAEFSKLDKTYEVSFELGQTSTTGDGEGEKSFVSDKQPTIDEIHQVINQFQGETSQVPPAFSAIKVNGQRAYKLAREGKDVIIEPRTVRMKIADLEYEYPNICFVAEVSSGTYIRSLVEDIGKALGTGAYMSDLRRTSVGQFLIGEALRIDDLNPDTLTPQEL